MSGSADSSCLQRPFVRAANQARRFLKSFPDPGPSKGYGKKGCGENRQGKSNRRIRIRDDLMISENRYNLPVIVLFRRSLSP